MSPKHIREFLHTANLKKTWCLIKSCELRKDMVFGMRIGMGYDVHRLVKDRELIIGGVNIPYELGLLGHSDADVLLHAISDALLGAAALGDIGKHFPDTGPAYKGISSIILLEKVGKLLEENMFFIENIDATIIAQAPKMRPHIDKMRENIAGALGIDISQVNVKATTEEGLGSIGRNRILIPDGFYKVLLIDDDGYKGIGFYCDNVAGKNKLSSYAMSIDSIEKMTGIDFFHKLPDEVEDVVESEYNWNVWR